MIPLDFPCCGNCTFLTDCQNKKDDELDEESWSICSEWEAGVTDGKSKNNSRL